MQKVPPTVEANSSVWEVSEAESMAPHVPQVSRVSGCRENTGLELNTPDYNVGYVREGTYLDSRAVVMAL